jgi:hypothetical protein
MGGEVKRPRLVARINEAFNRRNLHSTIRDLGELAEKGDFLDICHRLGMLDEIHGGDLATYKRTLEIPEVNRQILTTAFRTSLTQRMPLHISIISGKAEMVQVMSGDDTGIVVTLIRADIQRS